MIRYVDGTVPLDACLVSEGREELRGRCETTSGFKSIIRSWLWRAWRARLGVMGGGSGVVVVLVKLELRSGIGDVSMASEWCLGGSETRGWAYMKSLWLGFRRVATVGVYCVEEADDTLGLFRRSYIVLLCTSLYIYLDFTRIMFVESLTIWSVRPCPAACSLCLFSVLLVVILCLLEGGSLFKGWLYRGNGRYSS